MELVVLEDIHVEVDIEQLVTKLNVLNEEVMAEVENLLAEALRVARPRAVYKTAYISQHGEDFVTIDDIVFNSHILRINLDNVFKVFPYIVTSGAELDTWVNSHRDALTRYLADTINEIILQNSVALLKNLMTEQNNTDRLSVMNPGSLADWPLNEQVKLFDLLGSPQDLIGVTLTDSFLMLPIKSVSGIAFFTEVAFENCQLCPRANCPGRKALYDPDLYRRKYRDCLSL